MSKQVHWIDCWGREHSAELTTRPVIDRITPKHPRTKYKGEGICLGAWVTGRGKTLPWHSTIPGITGQIWAQAAGKGNWWVVTEQGHAYIMHEYSMTLLGQASEDVPLFEEDAS